MTTYHTNPNQGLDSTKMLLLEGMKGLIALYMRRFHREASQVVTLWLPIS